MPTDTPRGKVCFFEDFLYDVVADKPEYGVDTDPAVEIVTTAPNGVVRVTMDAGQTNIGGMGFGNLQWDISNRLTMEARVRMSAIGAAAERYFVGFTDVQEDTLTEMPFSATGTTLTASADPNDAIGFFFEGNLTNDAWYPVSQNTDVIVVNGVANVTAANRFAPVADTWRTLKIDIFPGATVVEFSVDGRVVYRYSGTTAAVADVPLIPIFVVTEGTTAVNFDVDYVYVEADRSE